MGAISPLSGSGWGGARNGVSSSAMTLGQVLRLHDAAERAVVAGLGFNRFVTVNWTALGVADSGAARLTGRLVKLASDWCASKGTKLAWAWVRENDNGDGSKGSHVHMVLHCPAELAIGRMWRRWLRRLTGIPYRKGGICSRTIGATLTSCMGLSNHYRVNLGRVLDYMCKGAAPEAARALCLPWRESTGQIVGKRSAVWQRWSK